MACDRVGGRAPSVIYDANVLYLFRLRNLLIKFGLDGIVSLR
jgi:hypothetical protein